MSNVFSVQSLCSSGLVQRPQGIACARLKVINDGRAYTFGQAFDQGLLAAGSDSTADTVPMSSFLRPSSASSDSGPDFFGNKLSSSQALKL